MCQETKLLLLLLTVFQAGRASICEMYRTNQGHTLNECCNEAWGDRCYMKSPFRDCCDQTRCSNHSNMKCTWKFEMPCCKPLEGTFEVNNADCLEACELLGSQTFKYTDYCPDGALWQHSLITAKCSNAGESLKKALQESTENNKWCSSSSTVKCTWNTSTFNKADEKMHQSLYGSFNYTDDADHFCAYACKNLTVLQLSQAEYCDRESTFHQNLVLCDPLKEELHKQCPHAYMGTELKRHGFTAEVAEVPVFSRSSRRLGEEQGNTSRRLGEEQDNACKIAFNSGCYSMPPWRTCCSSCIDASATFSCTGQREVGEYPPYKFNYKGVVDQDKYEPCVQVCNELNTADRCSRPPGGLCDDDFRQTKIKKCPALTKILETPPAWCKKVCSPALSAVRPSSDALSQIPAAMVGILVLVALVVGAVAARNHRSSREEGYRPFNDQSVLAGSTI